MRITCKNLLVSSGIALAVGWLGLTISGDALSQALAARLGAKLRAAGEGVIADPTLFIHARMVEILWIATVAGFLAVFLALSWKWIDGIPRIHRSKGLIMGFVGFAAVNILIGTCGNTAAFWIVLHDSQHMDNLVRYQLKKCLLEESGDRRRILIVGNSQANRSIDETLINRALAQSSWTTEMTQPGARGFDLLVLGRDMRPRRGDIVVFYLSEISFHGMSSGIVVADFLKFKDFLTAVQMGGLPWISPGAVKSGLFGRSIPAYRFRQPVTNRFLVWQSVPKRHDSRLSGGPPNMETMAKSWAPTLKIDDASQFERKSFEMLIGELIALDCRVILIPGHLHPALMREMDPLVAQSFKEWFKGLQKIDSMRVTHLGPERFFTPVDDDFDDLVHFDEQAQRRFTHELSGILEGVLK